jgi:D-lyxose ketol-isomerase
MTKSDKLKARARAAQLAKRARIVLTPKELKGMEIAHFAIDDYDRTGLAIVVYENNPRYCAKELILTGRQTCPQHRHPKLGGKPGKMETFRCRWGRVYLNVPGKPTRSRRSAPPKGDEKVYTVFHEIELKPGDQYTLSPNTWHWFQAGPAGAVVSEFSSPSHDEGDVFTDKRIQRSPKD